MKLACQLILLAIIVLRICVMTAKDHKNGSEWTGHAATAVAFVGTILLFYGAGALSEIVKF